jgi:hypothetical protein
MRGQLLRVEFSHLNFMKDDNKQNATWWTPTGWTIKEQPQAFIKPTLIGWEEMLEKAGYEPDQCYGGWSADLSLTSRRHNAEAHLLVIVGSGGYNTSQFFVAWEHREIFFASWYVQFVRDAAVATNAWNLNEITKLLATFMDIIRGSDGANHSTNDPIKFKERVRESLDHFFEEFDKEPKSNARRSKTVAKEE